MATGISTSDKSSKYDMLPSSDLEHEADLAFEALRRSKSTRRLSWRTLCIATGVTNLVFIAYIVFQLGVFSARIDKAPSQYPQPAFEPRIEYRQMWNHDSGSNWTENELFWESLLPGHGLVLIDRSWAAARNWDESVDYPKDHSKAVYALEAYHQLHCLKNIRKTFWEAHDGEAITWPDYHPHMEHCFESLRQAIMCNADNSALYTYGGDTIGHGQLRQCRSWEQLRDWATEHSACYLVDPTPMPLKNRFDACDNGFDGMLYRQ